MTPASASQIIHGGSWLELSSAKSAKEKLLVLVALRRSSHTTGSNPPMRGLMTPEKPPDEQ
jgi:acetyl-CoA acetyltransferase